MDKEKLLNEIKSKNSEKDSEEEVIYSWMKC
jgi:hypothetical protein